MHASGYIMKPVTAEKIRAEISDLRYQISSLPESKGTPTASWKNSVSGIMQSEVRANSQKSGAALEEDQIPAGKEPPLLRFQCFGNFDVFTPDHNLVHFERSRSKELLAYLVYLHGSSVPSGKLLRFCLRMGFTTENSRHMCRKLSRPCRTP